MSFLFSTQRGLITSYFFLQIKQLDCETLAIYYISAALLQICAV